jgi:predicted NBD/HSP70 family sugar kinase
MATQSRTRKTSKRSSGDSGKGRPGAVGGLRKDRKVHTTQQQNASSELARDINRDIVLELLRTRQPISRVELSTLSGLQRSTVSLIVEDLLREQWVTEGASIKTARGRRPTMLSLNENLVILVADIRPSQAILALIDLNARFLSREVVPLSVDPVVGVSALIERMKRVRSEFPNKICEGIGISMPGRVNPDTQQLVLAPNLHWKRYDTKERVQQEMQLQVEMDNAANACLMSELWFGRLAGVRNAVLITISEGLGAAIYADGQIILGGGGLAGEFGHIPIDESGPRCGCGLNGCWEMFASSRAALRFHSESKAKQSVGSIEELISLAADGQQHAIAALNKQAEFIGRGLRMITAALSPDLILFAGDITASWARSGPIIEAAMTKRMLAGDPPKLVAIGDGELARLRGAAALVLQRHSGYYRSPRPNSGQRVHSQDPQSRRVSAILESR